MAKALKAKGKPGSEIKMLLKEKYGFSESEQRELEQEQLFSEIVTARAIDFSKTAMGLIPDSQFEKAKFIAGGGREGSQTAKHMKDQWLNVDRAWPGIPTAKTEGFSEDFSASTRGQAFVKGFKRGSKRGGTIGATVGGVAGLGYAIGSTIKNREVLREWRDKQSEPNIVNLGGQDVNLNPSRSTMNKILGASIGITVAGSGGVGTGLGYMAGRGIGGLASGIKDTVKWKNPNRLPPVTTKVIKNPKGKR